MVLRAVRLDEEIRHGRSVGASSRSEEQHAERYDWQEKRLLSVRSC